MSKIALELEINPFLNTSEFNRIIGALKNSLGDSVKFKPIDDKDFKTATKEAKNLNDETKETKDNIKEMGNEAQKLPTFFESVKNSLKDSLNLDSIMNFTAGGLATSAISTGVSLITENFADALNAGNEFNNALLDMQAKTGATADEMKLLEEASIKAFEGGVGESLADAVKIIGEAQNRLGNVFSGNELSDFTKKANALGNAYELDVNEVIKKSEPFIKQFGLGAEESFNLIAYAQKEGKTASDDILDSLAEYSQLASQAGYSAQDFTQILVSGAKEGIFNTDKLADSIKEAEIRIKAGDYSTAFKGINEGASKAEKAIIAPIQAIVEAGNRGELTIQETLQKSTKLIDDAFKGGQISESLASQLQVAIAGTPAEDIGTELFGKIFSAPLDKNGIDKKAKEVGDNLSNAVGQYTTFDATSKKITSFVTQISSSLVSGFDKSVKFIGELLNSTLFTYFTEIFNSIGETIKPIFNEISELGSAIAKLFNIGGEGIGILNILQSTFKFLGQVVGELISIAITPLITTFRIFVATGRLVFNFLNLIVSAIKESSKEGGFLFSVFEKISSAINKTKTFINDAINSFKNFGLEIYKSSPIITSAVDFVSKKFQSLVEFVNKVKKGFNDLIDFVGLSSSKTNNKKIEPQFDDKKLQSFRNEIKSLKDESKNLTQEEIKLRQDAIAKEINSEVSKKSIQSNNAEELKKQLYQIGAIQKTNNSNTAKEVADNRSLYEIAKEKYELKNKENQRAIELQKIELETQRALENTTLTVQDELLLNNLIVNEQKRQLKEAEKLLAIKKKDKKEIEDAKNLYEDLKKSIATTELNEIKIKAKLELEQKEIENIQKQINRNILETEIKLKLRAESDLIVDDIRNLNEVILELESELNKAKVGINTKAQAEINLKLTEAQNALIVKQLELEDKRETERLNKIINSDEKIRETQLSNLNKTYSEQLNIVKSNTVERIKLELQYQKEKQKIENEYLDKTKDKYTKSAEELANSFSNSLSNLTVGDFGLNTEAEAQAREVLKSIENEEKQLRISYNRRQIDKKEYYEKLAELDEKRKEQDNIIRDNQFDFFKGLNKGIADSLSEQRNNYIKFFEDNINDYKIYQEKIKEIDKETLDKELELAKAKADGNFELEIKLNDEIKELGKKRKEDVELSNAKMSEAYEDLAISAGLSMGQMIAQGESLEKAFLKSTLSSFKSVIPLLIAQIFGKSFAQLGPIGGPLATGVITGAFYALIAKAESSISAFRKGGVFGSLEQLRENGGGLIRGGERVERVRFNEDGEEFFVNHKATKLNITHLDKINKYNLRIEDYAVKIPEVQQRILADIKPIRNITYINNNVVDSKQLNQLVSEVKELKELSRSNHRAVTVTNELDVKMKFNENRFIEDTNIKIRKNIRR